MHGASRLHGRRSDSLKEHRRILNGQIHYLLSCAPHAPNVQLSGQAGVQASSVASERASGHDFMDPKVGTGQAGKRTNG